MLAGGDEVFAVGGDVEGSRHGFGGRVADGAEGSLFLIDGETGDGVVAAVGDVDEFPGGVNLDVGGGFSPLEAFLRQGGDGLRVARAGNDGMKR